MGEEEKKQLRRFINSVFFRDHDAQLQAETEEYLKLNVAKKVEREEAAKKALEEAQKASAGEGEKKSKPQVTPTTDQSQSPSEAKPNADTPPKNT